MEVEVHSGRIRVWSIGLFKNVIAGDPSRMGKQITGMQTPPGSSVIDIGAGSGMLVMPLSRAGCSVTTIELSTAE